MVLLGRSPHRSSFQRYTAEDDRLAAQALVRVGARHLADRIFGTLSRGGGTACPHRPHPWHNKPTTSFSTNRPTTSISATSTRSSNSSVPSTSPPSSCSTTSTSPPATATGWSPQPRQVACTGTPDEPLTSAILEPVYGVGVCRLSDNGTVQLVSGTPTTPPPSRMLDTTASCCKQLAVVLTFPKRVLGQSIRCNGYECTE